MKYNEQLAQRVRQYLSKMPLVEEIEMFNGLVFMVNDKMCAGVRKADLMLRLDPKDIEKLLEMDGCRQMMMKERVMKGFVLIDEVVVSRNKDLYNWLELALAFNPFAKASAKRKKKR